MVSSITKTQSSPSSPQQTITSSSPQVSADELQTLRTYLIQLQTRLNATQADNDGKISSIPVIELHKQMHHAIIIVANKLQSHIDSGVPNAEVLNQAKQVQEHLTKFHHTLTASSNSCQSSVPQSNTPHTTGIDSNQGFNREMRQQIHNSTTISICIIESMTNYLNTHPTLTTKDKECLQLAGQALSSLAQARGTLQKLYVASTIIDPQQNLNQIESAL